MQGKAHTRLGEAAMPTFLLLLIKLIFVSCCCCVFVHVHLVFPPPARFYVSDPSIVLYLRCFSGKSLDHFSVGEKPSSINHHSWGPGEKEVAPDVRIPGQRASPFCLPGAASSLLARQFPIRNLCFSNPGRSTLPPLNLSAISEEPGFL